MTVIDFDTLVSSRYRDQPFALSLGVFDGLHRGHMKILEKLVEKAEKQGCKSCVITFNRNPKMAAGRKEPRLPLLSQDRFYSLLEKIGVDVVAVIDFSPAFSQQSGVEFMRLLENSFLLKSMVVGADFQCGTPASCVGVDWLREHLSGPGECEVVPLIRLESGEEISSSAIRKLLTTGTLDKVRMMLGRPYGLDITRELLRLHPRCLCIPLSSLEQMVPGPGNYIALAEYDRQESREVRVRLNTHSLCFTEDPGEVRMLTFVRREL